MKKYQVIIGRYDIDLVLPNIKVGNFTGRDRSTSKIQIGSYEVNNNSLRLRTFATKGTTCVSCGLKAEYFQLEFLDEKATSPHLNLYGIKNKAPILFTRDHIIPLSKGGPDNLENLQTMCTKCNCKKGNTYEEPKEIQ